MRRGILMIALMAFVTFGFSQEIRTIFSNDDSATISFGGYGGPIIEAVQINHDWGLIMGGKGGVIINRRFAFGGIGKGTISQIDLLGDDLNDNSNASLTLTYGAGGVFAEYIAKSESPIHFTIPINLMAGRISIEEAISDGSEIESSGFFVIEPGINLEFNMSKSFVPGIHLSYRQTLGSSLVNLSNQDLSGLNIGLVFKFGSF